MDITAEELKQKLEKKEDFVLIDVREDYEHQEFNVGGKLIPLGTLPLEIANLKEHQDKEVVVYCRSGNRSGMAQQMLKAQGFSNVRNLLGGMMDYAAKYPQG